MPLAVETFTVIYNRLALYLQANTARITDYNKGSAARSILEAVALEFDKQYYQLENVQKASYINTAVGDDLAIKALDYGLNKIQATSAQVTITLTRNTPAPIGGVPIPINSVWTTVPQFSAFDAIRFQNPLAATFPAGDTTFDLAVTAVVPGLSGNVPSGSIIVNASNVPGIDAVTNTLPSANGDDEESDNELRSRLSLKIKGNNAGTENSYKSILLANTSAVVSSVSIVGPGEPLMTRDAGAGGKADIYFKGNLNPNTFVESFVYDNSLLEYFFSPDPFDPPDFPNERRVPVVSITKVEDLTAADIVPPGDYTLTNDSTIFGGSDRAQDKVVFINSPARDGHNFRITFIANQTVGDLRFLIEPTRPITADILIKQGLQADLDGSFKPFYAPGVDTAAADAAMLTVLSEYVNELGLGATIYLTEAIRRMSEVKVNGLTAVIGFDKLLSSLFLTGIPTSDSSITLDKNQYFVLNTVTFT